MTASDARQTGKKGLFAKNKGYKIGAIIILVIFLGAGSTFAYMYHQAQKIVKVSYVPTHAKKLRPAGPLIDNKRPISVLLLGTDTGAEGRDYKGRTDTMMLMTLNPTQKTTNIISIPRDMEVTIPGFSQYAPSKINAAYAYGSAGTAITTVQAVIKNPVDFYVLINMGGLEKVINDAHGVDVVSPLTFNFAGYQFTKGHKYHMDGKMALQFSRMRHEDPLGDYGRQNRQRLVLMALIKELKKPSNITNTKLLTEFAKNVQTDLTFNQIQALLFNYRDAADHVIQDHIQGQGQMINGQSFEVVSTTEQNRIASEISENLQS